MVPENKTRGSSPSNVFEAGRADRRPRAFGRAGAFIRAATRLAASRLAACNRCVQNMLGPPERSPAGWQLGRLHDDLPPKVSRAPKHVRTTVEGVRVHRSQGKSVKELIRNPEAGLV